MANLVITHRAGEGRLDAVKSALENNDTGEVGDVTALSRGHGPMSSDKLDWPPFDIDAFVAMHKRQRLEWEQRQGLEPPASGAGGVASTDVSIPAPPGNGTVLEDAPAQPSVAPEEGERNDG
jgi:hypothetical protein